MQSLTYEKENNLRMMMKMQGLDDRAFYIVNYIWQFLLYLVFVSVFVSFGTFMGLSVFIRNSLGVQASQKLDLLNSRTLCREKHLLNDCDHL